MRMKQDNVTMEQRKRCFLFCHFDLLDASVMNVGKLGP
jgi:hypothetical protein